MSTEIIEDIDAELKNAGVTEITSNLVMVEGKKPETQISSVQTAVPSILETGYRNIFFVKACCKETVFMGFDLYRTCCQFVKALKLISLAFIFSWVCI